MKKYIAECLGTFTLSFVVLLAISAGSNLPFSIPLIAGVTLGLFVYTIGGISGSHINPAVTVGALSLKKISMTDATSYIIFQFIGGLIALLLATMVFHVSFSLSFAQNPLIPFIAEALGTFFFTFGIAGAVYGIVPKDASGLVIGASLLLGIIIASFSGSAGILNPAVALAVMLVSHSFSWVYIVAPLVGSYCGMQTYKYLSR